MEGARQMSPCRCARGPSHVSSIHQEPRPTLHKAVTRLCHRPAFSPPLRLYCGADSCVIPLLFPGTVVPGPGPYSSPPCSDPLSQGSSFFPFVPLVFPAGICLYYNESCFLTIFLLVLVHVVRALRREFFKPQEV